MTDEQIKTEQKDRDRETVRINKATNGFIVRHYPKCLVFHTLAELFNYLTAEFGPEQPPKT